MQLLWAFLWLFLVVMAHQMVDHEGREQIKWSWTSQGKQNTHCLPKMAWTSVPSAVTHRLPGHYHTQCRTATSRQRHKDAGQQREICHAWSTVLALLVMESVATWSLRHRLVHEGARGPEPRITLIIGNVDIMSTFFSAVKQRCTVKCTCGCLESTPAMHSSLTEFKNA